MDDNTKTLNQNTNTPLASSTTQVPTQSPVQPAQIHPQAQNVGLPNKEQEPLRSVIEKSDVEMKIDNELKDIGVETKSDDVNLTQEHIQAGLQHAGSSVPVSMTPSSNAQMPQTPMQIKIDIKKTKPTDSLRGLLLEILKNIQKIGLKEQKT